MSCVHWSRPRIRSYSPPFVACPPTRIVRLLTSPEQHAAIRLHWADDRRGSYPCLGESCRYCPDPFFEHAYAPCLMLDRPGGSWSHAIIDLGDAAGKLANTDYVNLALYVEREGGSDVRSKLQAAKFVSLSHASLQMDATPFDVRPHLMRRYGLHLEAAKLLLGNPDADHPPCWMRGVLAG